MMRTLGHYLLLKCSVMRKLIMIGLLLFSLSVFSQSFSEDLRFSAFIGEGMGTGFGIETNRDKTIEYSFSLGYGELVYNTYKEMNIGYSAILQHDNFFQLRMSIPVPDSLNGRYRYTYSSVFHLSFINSIKICDFKNILLQLSIGSQIRLFTNNKKEYLVEDSNIFVVPVTISIDDKLVNKKYHNINFGFLSTAKVSFFNNKSFSPFLSYGGFVDVVDATKFKWLHVFQLGLSYNWRKSDKE